MKDKKINKLIDITYDKLFLLSKLDKRIFRNEIKLLIKKLELKENNQIKKEEKQIKSKKEKIPKAFFILLGTILGIFYEAIQLDLLNKYGYIAFLGLIPFAIIFELLILWGKKNY